MKYKFILILLILAGLVFVLVFYFRKSSIVERERPSARSDAASGGDAEAFVVAHPFDLNGIQSFTKYRSCAGHNYSGKTVDGDVEDNRSMKHYVTPLDSVFQSRQAIPIYAPFDGEISDVSYEESGKDYQVWLTPNPGSIKQWQFIFFHVVLDDGFKEGSSVAAGERIGRVQLTHGGNFDISAKQTGPFSRPLLDAPLEHFSPRILADYAAKGVTLEDAIISKEYRDQHPCPIIPGTEGRDARFPSEAAEDEVVFLRHSL